MSKRPYLTDAQRDEIVRRVQDGEAMKAIARDMGISYEAVKTVRRARLGPARAPHKPVSPEVEREICEEYRGWKTWSELCDRYGVGRQKLYEILDRHGVERKWLKLPPLKVYCVVCGGPITLPPRLVANPRERRRARAKYINCCSDDCRTIKASLPDGAVERRHYDRKVVYRSGKSYPSALNWTRRRGWWIDPAGEIDPEAHVATTASSGSVEPGYEIREDERGIRRPEALTAIWSRLSRVSVALRLVAEREAVISLVLDLRPGERGRDALARLVAGGDLTTLKNFDVVLAWRCSCPAQATWSIESPRHVPDEPGYYGICPVCRAMALKVDADD